MAGLILTVTVKVRNVGFMKILYALTILSIAIIHQIIRTEVAPKFLSILANPKSKI
jgi:hypothetical protein